MNTTSQIISRIEFAMTVLDKDGDGPVCKNKDCAEAVAELMRLSEDACDSIKRLQAEVQAWRRKSGRVPESTDVDINGDLL